MSTSKNVNATPQVAIKQSAIIDNPGRPDLDAISYKQTDFWVKIVFYVLSIVFFCVCFFGLSKFSPVAVNIKQMDGDENSLFKEIVDIYDKALGLSIGLAILLSVMFFTVTIM